MRITTGRWRGKTILAPEGDAVRPTSDKVRQAVFNILKTYALPEGAIVLDAFCGTGALGLEALSRGAAHVIFLDRDLDACRRNAAAFKIEKPEITLIECDAGAPGRPPPGERATLLFLDPPYRLGLVPRAVAALARENWLAAGAICVAEVEANLEAGAPAFAVPGFTLLDDRRYGRTRILFLRAGA